MAIVASVACHTQELQMQDRIANGSSTPVIIMPEVSPKLLSGDANPLLDFIFTADFMCMAQMIINSMKQ